MQARIFYKKVKVTVLGILCCLAATTRVQALTDTLVLQLAEAEAIFLDNNLQLLAGKLGIDEAKAKVIQAKLWPNPTLSITEVNGWANAGSESLGRLTGNWGNHAQVAIDVEQLIQTAGKRRKLLAIEETGVRIAEQEFEVLLRSLQLELRAQLALLRCTQERLAVYGRVLVEQQRLATGYERQLAQGNVGRGDYVRLKASAVALRHDLDGIRNENLDAQRALKALLGLAPTVNVKLAEEPSATPPTTVIKALTADTVARWAYSYHTALKPIRTGITQAEQQLRYEKARRIPDLTVAVGYDRGGNIMRDFVGVGISMDLPIFNRNQGQIKAAHSQVELRRLDLEYVRNEVTSTAIEAWKNLLSAVSRSEQLGEPYSADIDAVLVGYRNSFAHRNTSLLEYLDFLDAYLTTKDNLLETERQLLTQYETLRYYVGDRLPAMK